MDVSMSSLSSSGLSNNNVIVFPKKNQRATLPAEDTAMRDAARRTYVDEVVEAYANHIANKLAQQGFDVFNKDFDKHYGFTVEALRSTLLMSLGLDHPFQEVVEQTVKSIEATKEDDDDDFDPA